MGRYLTSVLLLGLLLMPAAGPAAGETLEIKAMLDSALAKAREVDRDAWGRHSFKRHVTRQQLDDDGDVEFRQVMLFQITPTAEGFDEQLLKMDGRKPTEKEVAKHRKAGKFEKHYAQTDGVILSNPFGADLPLLPLIYEQQHRYVGEEAVAGIPCHRIRFDTRPDPADAPIEVRLRHAMKGSLCISKVGSRLLQVEAESVREVRKGPIRIHHMGLRFESRPHGDVWLPEIFELKSDVRLLGQKMRRHNIYRFSDYRPR